MKHPLKYQTETAKELRALVLAINKVVSESPVMSIAQPVMSNACDHLSAIARAHECNEDRRQNDGLQGR